MKDFQPQIQLIKDKLLEAKVMDTALKVFGASSHEYQLNSPIDMKTVEDFERKHKISLPIEYKLFVTEIGNGGSSFSDSGAGPYYGIFPFGADYSLFEVEDDILQNPTMIYPKMTDEIWNTQIDHLYEEGISDNEFEHREAKLFGGLFAIGTQGCTYFHCLVLNGDHKGRIVNIDVGYQKPKFSFETNFLDWYERWLDDVIEGNLSDDDSGSFGYQMSGKEEDLLEIYQNTTDIETKSDVLKGLLFKQKLSTPIIDEMQFGFYEQSKEIQMMIINILLKNDYNTAVSYVKRLLDENLNDALKLIHWYAKDHKHEWILQVQNKLSFINDADTYQFATYILQEDPELDFEKLKPFTTHEDQNIRKQTFYTFSFLKDKSAYENEFLIGLKAENSSELIEVLQAMEGLKTKSILHKLKELTVKFPLKEVKPDKFGMRHYNDDVDESVYISSNLKSVLEEYGLNYQTIHNIDIDNFDLNEQ